MADIISRLKLESGEFDSKIKRAGQEIMAYSEHCRKMGLEMGYANKDAKDFAKSLGSMQTVSTSARGKINELSDAFVNLKVMYKNLTDEEKNNTFGKNLAASLDQLKVRIQNAKKDLSDVTAELNGNAVKAGGGGLLAGLGGKMEGALAVFGGNLMTKAAGAVASLGTEMFNSVQQGIELARQGEGIRVAFERLGNGQILQGLREATHGTVTDIELMKAAVKFNDFKLPVEELGTMLAFAQQKAKDTGQSVDYMVDSIVTGLGRKSLMILDNLGLSATEVKEKMKETGDMTKAVGQIIREQMAKAGDYVETAADRAAQANVSLQNKMEELGRKFAPVEEASNSLWTSMKIGIMDIIGGPLATLLNQLTQAGRMANAYGLMGGNAKVGRMTANLAGASEGKRQSIYQQQQAQFWRYINPREQQIKDIRAWQSGDRNEALQKRIGAITEKYGSLDATKIQAEVDAAKKMLADYQAAAKQILQPIEQKIVPTFGDGGSGGGVKSGKGGSSKGFDISSIAFDANKAGLAAAMSEEEPSEIWKALTDNMKKSKSNIEELTEALEKLNKAEGITPQGTNNSEERRKDNTANDIRSVADGVGSMVSGLNQLGIELPEGLSQLLGGFQAFTSILSGIATIVAVIAGIQAAKATPVIGWLLARGGTNRNGRIIHAATGYTVPGNFMSGDQVPAMLNSGETVLNKAQTAQLSNELSNNQPRAMRVNGRISGHDIVLAADRSLAQEGKGHIVTWK